MDMNAMMQMGQMQQMMQMGQANGMDMNAMMQMMMGMMGGKGKGKGAGKAAAKREAGEKLYQGTLVKFNAEKKSGFLHCREIMDEYGCEVYAFQTILEQCGAGVGDEVAFFLHWSAKDQPQASAPLLRLSSAVENNLVLKGMFKKPRDKEFGFIECAESQDFFGRDVYVPANLCEGLTAGMQVAFGCTLNREGMPNCRVVCPCEDSYQPVPGDLSETKEMPNYIKGLGKGVEGIPPPMQMMMAMMGMPPSMVTAMMNKGASKGKGKGKGKGDGPYSSGKKPTGTGQFLTGVVKSFNTMNNYGFIACEEAKAQYGADVFCGGDLSKFPVGTAVLFQLALNDSGKPQALDISQV